MIHHSWQTWREPTSFPYSCLLSMAALTLTGSQIRNSISDAIAFYRIFGGILLVVLLDVPHKDLLVHSSKTQM